MDNYSNYKSYDNYTEDDTEVQEPMRITYHIDRAENAGITHVFLTIWDSAPDCNPGMVMVYSPIGQHSEASIEYVRKARKITCKEYLRLSEGIYTPEEYILL